MKQKFLIVFFIFFSICIYADESNRVIPKLNKVGVFSCGKQPKQVLFTPDEKYIVLPLLDDTGFDVFSISEKKIIKRIIPPYSDKKGFVEGLFIPEKNAFFISQMTTGSIHEFSYPGFEFKRTIFTDGTWSKFMVWSKESSFIAVSNWVSNDISLINYDTGEIVKKIKTAAAPRGMIFFNNGKNLISLAFDGGKIEKIDIDTGKILDSIYVEKSAMRHIVITQDESYAFVSDMFHRCNYKIDLNTFKIIQKTRVFSNPNTIDLLNNRWLFVSSRGPNNPEDYTKRSPVNGKITIIDTDNMTVVNSFEGGNQPTGLDVSDNNIFCFSNFQDATIEIYNIEN